MTDTRVIKRYANRKMYDTARSCYVTLEEVADMVRAGADVKVIDNKTKEDLTEVTLTQALLDSERRNRGTVSLAGLRTLISHGAESLTKRVTEPVSRVREEAERTVTAWRDEAGRTVEDLQHRIDDQIRHALHGLGAPVATERELDPLRRVEGLEARTKAIEARNQSIEERSQAIEERVLALEAARRPPP